jgi:hypothetical protein
MSKIFALLFASAIGGPRSSESHVLPLFLKNILKMAAKSVNILCVNNNSLSQRMEINEKDSLMTLKLKMEIKEARFVYGGRELLEDEDLYGIVLEGTTIHLVVSGNGNTATVETSRQETRKEEPTSSKIPEQTPEATVEGIDLYLAPMFSLVPITPQIITIK